MNLQLSADVATSVQEIQTVILNGAHDKGVAIEAIAKRSSTSVGLLLALARVMPHGLVGAKPNLSYCVPNFLMNELQGGLN